MIGSSIDQGYRPDRINRETSSPLCKASGQRRVHLGPQQVPISRMKESPDPACKPRIHRSTRVHERLSQSLSLDQCSVTLRAKRCANKATGLINRPMADWRATLSAMTDYSLRAIGLVNKQPCPANNLGCSTRNPCEYIENSEARIRGLCRA